MTRNVLTNDMVAHVWAQQSQQSGRSGNGQFYFEGPTLYSYGTHYPVGTFAKDKSVFLNSTHSTPTTEGRHKSRARRALPDYGRDAFPMPELDEILPAIRAANESGRLLSCHVEPVTRYLKKHWQSIPADSAGAAWLLRAIGSHATWAAMRAKQAAKSEKAAAIGKARLKAHSALAGREMVAKPWPEMRADAWQEAISYRQSNLRHTIASIRAARLATPKAHKRIRAELWQREKALRAILVKAELDADRRGNPGERTKARAVIGRLRRFKAGQIGTVPGYPGLPDGPAKLEAALAMPNGAAWRMLASALAELARLPVHMPTGLRAAGLGALWAKADGIAAEREGEESIRQDIAAARREMLWNLSAFNAARRLYYRTQESGAWDSVEMTDRQRGYALDGIIGNPPAIHPQAYNARGLERSPALAARNAAIAARGAEIVAELEPIRDAIRSAAEREAAARRAADHAVLERVRAMTPEQKREAWQAGELNDGHVRGLAFGPLLRAVNPEIDGCKVTGGELVTSEGARVPLRHAFRVFQLVAYCRANRLQWESGIGAYDAKHNLPKRVRVGHFTLDSIDQSGNFRAGCHNIQWPEIAALAELLGVADCLASLPEIAAELSEGESA